MIGVYFSGTGNSKYCLEKFIEEYNNGAKIFSIEDDNILEKICYEKEIIISYPIQYSNIPKILSDFIDNNKNIWENKKIFIICTMALFSGDGAGVLARKLKKYGSTIIGGLHLKMPDSICDEPLLKRNFDKNKKLILNTEQKIKKSAYNLRCKKSSKDGIGVICRLIGFFGQRLYFGYKTKSYSDKLKINKNKCINCGKCIRLCPMKNIYIYKEKAKSNDRCTMCYRCVNECPQKAITLLGKKVIKQYNIKNYL